MRRIFALLPLVALAILGTLSCDDEKEEAIEETKEESKEEKAIGPQIVTLDAEKGTLFVVSLYGRVSGLEGDALYYECGIEYSTDESFNPDYSYRKNFEKKNTDDSYSITISGIQPSKKYYYRTYFINQSLIYYGEVKSFTFEWTAPAVTTVSAELNESGAVVLKGLVKEKGALVKDLRIYYAYDSYGYYGIEYSTTEDFDENSTTSLYTDRKTDSMDNDSVICMLTLFRYGTTYYYRTFFRLGEIQNYGDVKTFKFEWDGPKMVDLGLSVKWATCNVGATSPWDYGDYYAWGETETKSVYFWPTYKYCNGSYTTMTKYCNYSSFGNNGFTDTKTTLDPKDDVAHVKWGDSWRMPTQTEMNELSNRDNCTWTWTTQKGVKGYLVTSKKSGHEGASIFLPAAGFRLDIDFCDVGSGYYWSSSLSKAPPYYAQHLHIESGGYRTSGYERYCGFTIRPVCP
jgi:hypothetical protein